MKHLQDCLQWIPIVVTIQHLCHYFRIRLRLKLITFFNQSVTQGNIIFNNTIVHDCNCLILIKMWMRIYIVGCAMSSPSRMADSHEARHCLPSVCQLFQHFQPAYCLSHIYSCSVKYCHSGGIIPSVFQSGKSVQYDRCRLLFADISYDTTHDVPYLSLIPCQ